MDPITQSLKVDNSLQHTSINVHSKPEITDRNKLQKCHHITCGLFQVVFNQNNEQLMFPMFHRSNTRFGVQKDKAGASLNSLLFFWTWGSGRGYQKEYSTRNLLKWELRISLDLWLVNPLCVTKSDGVNAFGCTTAPPTARCYRWCTRHIGELLHKVVRDCLAAAAAAVVFSYPFRLWTISPLDSVP